MAKFDTGVKRYIATQATVKVYFPVDYKDREEITCRHCPYLSSNERMCWLNHEPIAFPDKFVGENCPLELIEKENIND